MADSFEDRIASEHERLQPLFAAVHRAFAGEATEPALRALADLRREIETHTAQEDQLYYPALWSLCPEHQERLREIQQMFDRRYEDLSQQLEKERQDRSDDQQEWAAICQKKECQ